MPFFANSTAASTITDNYVSAVQYGVSTSASDTGAHLISGNLIEAVTQGLNLSRAGTPGATVSRNTIRSLTGSGVTQAAVNVQTGAGTFTVTGNLFGRASAAGDDRGAVRHGRLYRSGRVSRAEIARDAQPVLVVLPGACAGLQRRLGLLGRDDA